MRKLVLLAMLAVAAMAVAGLAFAGSAAKSGSASKLGVKNGVITACVEVKNESDDVDETIGDIKLSNCEPGFRTLKWNQKGRKGDKGARGLRGATGVAGPAGPDSPDPNDPETQDAEVQDAEVQEAEIQNPEVDDPDPASLRGLTGPFSGTNATVATSLEGVQFGPYPDGGLWGGSVLYTGANGLTIADITQLAYTIKHSSGDDSAISSPYLRIFLEGDHDVIFDPTECATTVPDEDVFITYNVLAATPTGEFRYDDDPCGAAAVHLTWAQILAAHGDEVITGIYVTAGFSGGAPLAAILRELSVNGESFVLGAA